MGAEKEGNGGESYVDRTVPMCSTEQQRDEGSRIPHPAQFRQPWKDTRRPPPGKWPKKDFVDAWHRTLQGFLFQSEESAVIRPSAEPG